MMDAPPTRRDVELAYTLLTGQAPDTTELIDILRTQKTGTPVHLPLPPVVLSALKEVERFIRSISFGLAPERQRAR